LTAFQVISGVIGVVAVFGYFNHRIVKLPDAIGITATGVVVSIAAVVLGHFDAPVAQSVRQMVGNIDFAGILLHGALGPILFAGSLQISFKDIAKDKGLILALATMGVVGATLLVGGSFSLITRLAGVEIPFLYCLLFGALISPTDPIAVLAILKQVGIPKRLETLIAAESLFNDGTGVVIFLTILGLVSGNSATLSGTALLFITEVLGGAAFGALVGYAGVAMLRGVNSYPVEILITVAMATAGYAAAEAAHVSAPIAVVMMGLSVGNRGTWKVMAEETRQRLFVFWEVIDELLNLLLFGLIGLEIMTLEFSLRQTLIGGASIAIVLAARLLSIAGPILLTPRLRAFGRGTITIMTWGGLRGGISVALALSLPVFTGREIVVSTTYAVVIFSILVQALTLRAAAARALGVARSVISAL
jgi:monovalent cation:H+ antiporter, CPA1 family